jgi:hypothetical protein
MPESHIGRSRGAILGAASMAPSNWPITPFQCLQTDCGGGHPSPSNSAPDLRPALEAKSTTTLRVRTYINGYPKALIGGPWLVSELLYKQREELNMK